jgi:hypothetical protein
MRRCSERGLRPRIARFRGRIRRRPGAPCPSPMRGSLEVSWLVIGSPVLVSSSCSWRRSRAAASEGVLFVKGLVEPAERPGEPGLPASALGGRRQDSGAGAWPPLEVARVRPRAVEEASKLLAPGRARRAAVVAKAEGGARARASRALGAARGRGARPREVSEAPLERAVAAPESAGARPRARGEEGRSPRSSVVRTALGSTSSTQRPIRRLPGAPGPSPCPG